MARIVQKFGGTSVADLDRIRDVAARVKVEVDAGNEVAVVVSAWLVHQPAGGGVLSGPSMTLANMTRLLQQANR